MVTEEFNETLDLGKLNQEEIIRKWECSGLLGSIRNDYPLFNYGDYGYYSLPIVRWALNDIPVEQELVGIFPCPVPRMVIHKETIVGEYLSDGEIDWLEDKNDIEFTNIVEDAKNIINKIKIDHDSEIEE